MDTTKDYYDIPSELLPSSNFANRPASEISDVNLVDGLRTFIYSSGSSSSSSELEDTVTPTGPRDAAESLESESGALLELEATVTNQTVHAPQPRLRSLSNDMKIKERSQLRRKAATAPPGTLITPDYAPQPPRRTISARPTTSKERGRRQAVRSADRSDFRRKRDEDLKGPQRPLPSLPILEVQGDSGQTLKDTQLPRSFSQRPRVIKTLNEKKLARLQTDIVDFESRGLLSSPRSMLSSPRSMLNTPREMYAIPEKVSTSEAPSSPSSPHAKKAQRSIMSSLSGTSPKLHLSRARHCKSMHDGHTKRSNLSGQKRIYVPGAIRLEEHPAKLRKDSVASLEPFAKEVDFGSRRNSDMIVLDNITVFFDELGVVEDATEACLDRYWYDVASARTSIITITSIDETPVTSVEKPQQGRSTQGSSRFSFSSASSSSSQARNGTPMMRQRDKLRRLLSPAFPGSGFRG
jgi:hypothetical protein